MSGDATIMLVDDEDAIQKLLAYPLEREGYRVVQARDGEEALRRFAERLGRPQQPVLWPEHLDLAITLDEVNYGCSPGDAAIGEPYLYVGPHAGPPAPDPFWNAAFGAAMTADRLDGPEDAVGFFEQGRALTDRSAT